MYRGFSSLQSRQFYQLSTLEQDILYWLAIERKAVSIPDLCQDFIRPVQEMTLLACLNSLRHRSMIEMNDCTAITLTPEIMEYVTCEFVEKISDQIILESIDLLASHALIKAQ